MLKAKYLYGCLAAGLLLSIPLIAEAKIITNGTSFNGTNLNTTQITPAATQGIVRVESGQLVIQISAIAQ